VIDNVMALVTGIGNSFRTALPALPWIDQASREAALTKLKAIVPVIGHQNALRRFHGVVLDSNAARWANNLHVLSQRQFLHQFEIMGTPFNRSAQSQFPATIVNAFYDPVTNTINFPAGILEWPAYLNAPRILMFARMGWVVGHETTHAFDSDGRMWGPTGVYGDWMSKESSAAFSKQAQCIIDQYSSYTPLPGLHVNGSVTQGENIADNGGIKRAYDAYQEWVKNNGDEFKGNELVKGLTKEQLFFVIAGQTWCTAQTDDSIRNQIKFDVHSPSQYRVNGPFRNYKAFADAFQCKVGTPMNPGEGRCLVW